MKLLEFYGISKLFICIYTCVSIHIYLLIGSDSKHYPLILTIYQWIFLVSFSVNPVISSMIINSYTYFSFLIAFCYFFLSFWICNIIMLSDVQLSNAYIYFISDSFHL